MTDLNKYRRQNHNLLAKTEGVGNKRQKKYVEKITINLTQEEADTLNKMNEENGIPKGEIIRRELKKTGLFK